MQQTEDSSRGESESMDMAEFLATIPPGKKKQITRMWEAYHTSKGGIHKRFCLVPVKLDCRTCDGERRFRVHGVSGSPQPLVEEQDIFAEYVCSDCRLEQKKFALTFYYTEAESPLPSAQSYAGCVAKHGELPSFGTRTPNKLLRLLGDEKEFFLKGRQCENQGFGIGAFAYYRRVVENKKNTLLEKIISVAQLLGAESELISDLEEAKSKIQFQRSITDIKIAVPESLMVTGHNPLLLLHSALSKGLHGRTDEECLNDAHDVRIVLTELVERLSQLQADNSELRASVARLTKK